MSTIKITLKLLDVIESDNYRQGVAIVESRDKQKLKIFGVPENIFSKFEKKMCYYTSIGRIEIGDCFCCVFDSLKVKMDNSALYYISHDDVIYTKNIGSANKNE